MSPLDSRDPSCQAWSTTLCPHPDEPGGCTCQSCLDAPIPQPAESVRYEESWRPPRSRVWRLLKPRSDAFAKQIDAYLDLLAAESAPFSGHRSPEEAAERRRSCERAGARQVHRVS